LSREFVRDWQRILPVMAHFVVVQITPHWDTDTLEYMAFSELFDEIEAFDAAPEYRLVISTQDDEIVVKAEKVLEHTVRIAQARN